jgi:hypothetical protein
LALNVYEEVFENKLLPGMEPLLEPLFVDMIEIRDRLNELARSGKKEDSGTILQL